MDKAEQNMMRVMERILLWCQTTPEPKAEPAPSKVVRWRKVTNPDGSTTLFMLKTPPRE